jgi:hypothetical protein
VLVQAAALLAVIGMTVPSYFEYLTRPPNCTPEMLCIDLRGLPFEVSATFLGPPVLMLVAAFWLWRRPRRWPAVLPIVVDVAVITVVLVDIVDFVRTGSQDPNIVVQVLLGLVPALVSLILAALLLRPSSQN